MMFEENLLAQARADEARAYMGRYEDDAERLVELIELWGTLDRDDWTRLLGEHWTTCDQATHSADFLRLLLSEEPLPIAGMMTERERVKLAALPEELTVYRGCAPYNTNGICWTLRRRIAVGFPCDGDWPPLLLIGRVKRSRVVALKMDRDEDEIISFEVREVHRESLKDNEG